MSQESAEFAKRDGSNGRHDPIEATVGLLLSGGLDSAILLGRLLDQGRRVQPFYLRTGLVWQPSEHRVVQRLLAAFAGPRLAPLVVLDQPVDDLYGDHWGVTGLAPPDRFTPDEAMYLPGRNPLLLLKPMLWCGMHGVPAVALGSLESNPFADATGDFFDGFEMAIRRATGVHVRILRPLDRLSKREVLLLGRGYPLQHTISCVRPVGDSHCGVCNKCGERQAAFRDANLPDPADYATAPRPSAAGTPQWT